MKALKTFYWQVLLPACLCFTLLCFVFSAILQGSDSQMVLPTVNLANLAQIFAFSLVFSLSWQLFKSRKRPFWLSLVLHFLSFLASIAVIFFLIGGHYSTGRGAFLMLFVFAILYVMIAAVAVTIRHFILAGRNRSSHYKRQF